MNSIALGDVEADRVDGVEGPITIVVFVLGFIFLMLLMTRRIHAQSFRSEIHRMFMH